MTQAPCPLRLANLLQLQHPLSVDLYIEKTLSHAKLIVLRILGGASYWTYGLDQLQALARERGILLCVLPGDAQPDPELTRRSTLAPHHCERLRQYLVTGGAENASAFLAYCRHLLDGTEAPAPARELPKAGLYRDTSGEGQPLAAHRLLPLGPRGCPDRAHRCAGRCPCSTRGIGTRAFYVASLKDRASRRCAACRASARRT